MVEKELPKLGYEFDALEPFIDAKTMEIHYTKHHQAYLDKLNAAIEKYPELDEKTAKELLKDLDSVPEDIKTAVRNHGGGFVNHAFFWPLLKKDVPFGENSNVGSAIKEKFGDFDKFKEEFSQTAKSLFGSGWTWLVVNDSGELEIVKTANQDNPISEGKKPVLGIDMWEHAYYLKHQNKKADYIEDFFNVIDWEKVNENFDSE